MLLNRLFRVIAPFDCIKCGREGELLCVGCKRLISPLASRCCKCMARTVDGEICANCRLHTQLRRLVAVTEYAGAIKHLLHAYKFERAQDCSSLLAYVLLDALPYLPPETAITYVPTATSRVRQRGYDHAKLLAQAYAHHHKRKALPLLKRHGQTRQVGANRRQRATQLQGAFEVRKFQRVTGKRILIIDDILTTGATLEAAAGVLKQAGARSVDALVIAQKRYNQKTTL